MKLRLVVALCAVLSVSVWAASAGADPFAGPPICSSAGTALAGTYGNLTVNGNAYVASGTTLTVNGNLTLAPGACLDAFTLGTVTVGGNLLVGQGATLALGCTPGSLGPPIPQPPCGTTTTTDSVGGSVIANQPLTMYLDGDTVWGSVISTGGGPGATFSPYINFPIKDNTIYGNVIVQGWQGAWFGFIRNTTYGSVILNNNVGVAIGEFGADSTEVVTNVISGNLICLGNSPAAQVGDTGGSPNTVSGQKIGECAGL
jgi:hypothetical protein